MKILSLILTVSLFFCMNSYSIAGEAENHYDLSAPDSTVKSFLKAAKKGGSVMSIV